MNIYVFVGCSLIYIFILFFIAYITDKKAAEGTHWANNPYVYSLSMAVYCTAWTFYGSVGKAVKSGLGFLPIYVGVCVGAALWFLVLKKIIVISKNQRITSIADFISSRYGKSNLLGVLVTIVCFFSIIPYISLQLKAIADSFMVLAGMQNEMNMLTNASGFSFYYSTTFYIAILLILFTILFGARNLEPNERHEGMVTAIAFESIVKLVAFLAVGIFVTYGLYNGFGDLFQEAFNNPVTAKRLFLGEGSSPSEWFCLGLLSMFAIILLPRQFHIAVVENSDPNHVYKATWVFPLYLLIINIFVLPIALAGVLQFQGLDIRPDTFVLELPLENGKNMLALMVFIGGFSASTSMVIVEVNALGIMFSNHILLPPLLTWLARRDNSKADFSAWVLFIRRFSIAVIILLAFYYVRTIAINRELVSIGLVSFVAVNQFAPCLFLGLFWKKATQSGAIAGLLIGFFIWAIALPIPTLADYGFLSKSILTDGYFGQWWLNPHALFGLEGYDQISHATIWSLFFNCSTFMIVSLTTKQSTMEATQADYFVNIHQYINGGSDMELIHREAKMEDLTFLLTRFLGEERTQFLLEKYETDNNITLSKILKAKAELVNYVETVLAGALGAASAKILISSVVKEDPITLEEMLHILDKTKEVILTNTELKKKSKELEETTQQLQAANDQLKELDHLKADFVTTITHELRTPMTSIKALSKILMDNPDIPKDQHNEFLEIIVLETERITRLINQVLDIEKIQFNAYEWKNEPFNLTELTNRIYKGFQPVLDEKNIQHTFKTRLEQPVLIKGDEDRINQVIVNLMSNALKFTNTEEGDLGISLESENGSAVLKITDNGNGIAEEKQSMIFERFTQLYDPTQGKPTGSGLGLFITKQIVTHHKGTIEVESEVGKGATFVVKLPMAKG
ncbi:MAG: sensor histidine kinase [Saprospiraceae bacterium]|nr:sensor histidine kinase [Saprospiraceae bacterium]